MRVGERAAGTARPRAGRTLPCSGAPFWKESLLLIEEGVRPLSTVKTIPWRPRPCVLFLWLYGPLLCSVVTKNQFVTSVLYSFHSRLYSLGFSWWGKGLLGMNMIMSGLCVSEFVLLSDLCPHCSVCVCREGKEVHRENRKICSVQGLCIDLVWFTLACYHFQQEWTCSLFLPCFFVVVFYLLQGIFFISLGKFFF